MYSIQIVFRRLFCEISRFTEMAHLGLLRLLARAASKFIKHTRRNLPMSRYAIQMMWRLLSTHQITSHSTTSLLIESKGMGSMSLGRTQSHSHGAVVALRIT